MLSSFLCQMLLQLYKTEKKKNNNITQSELVVK